MKHEFDILLQQALHAHVQDVHPGEDQLFNIKRKIRQRKEKDTMKYGMKRMIAIAAALCLITVSCYAAVEMATIESHSMMEITKFENLAEAEQEAGLDIKCVEAFSNGFKFEGGGVIVSQAQDENGNPVGGETKGVGVHYTNDAGKNVMLSVEPRSFYEDHGQAVPVGYTSDTYKFVPPDYELTDEDRRLMEGGDFFVSYGSEAVELTEMEDYRWEDDGLVYSLLASGCGLGEAALVAMAQEVMNG